MPVSLPALPDRGSVDWFAWATAVHAQLLLAALTTDANAAYQPFLVPTGIKTGAYAAVSNDFVLVDASAGPITVSLPATPPDKTTIGLKKLDTSANLLTVARGGSDVFNATGGVTAISMKLAHQAIVLQYQAAGQLWLVTAGDLPLSQLDLRFAPLTSVSTITATSQAGAYTFALADAGTVVEGTAASAQTFTVPPSSAVAWPTGTVLEVFQAGTGQITLAAGAGVTLQPASAVTRTQYSTAGLRYRGGNVWAVSGDLV